MQHALVGRNFMVVTYLTVGHNLKATPRVYLFFLDEFAVLQQFMFQNFAHFILVKLH